MEIVMTALFAYALIGVALGLMAAWVLPDRKQGWIRVPLLVSSVGAVTGGVLGHVFTDTGFGIVTTTSAVLSVVCSFLALFMYGRSVPGARRRD